MVHLYVVIASFDKITTMFKDLPDIDFPIVNSKGMSTMFLFTKLPRVACYVRYLMEIVSKFNCYIKPSIPAQIQLSPWPDNSSRNSCSNRADKSSIPGQKQLSEPLILA